VTPSDARCLTCRPAPRPAQAVGWPPRGRRGRATPPADRQPAGTRNALLDKGLPHALSGRARRAPYWPPLRASASPSPCRMSQPASAPSPRSPLPTTRAYADGADGATPRQDERRSRLGGPPDGPAHLAATAPPADHERPRARGPEPAPPAAPGGPRRPVLMGRRAEGGWRCTVRGGPGVTGMAGEATDRPLPLATTLGELLAGRASAPPGRSSLPSARP
jgi:hypothetical protein